MNYIKHYFAGQSCMEGLGKIIAQKIFTKYLKIGEFSSYKIKTVVNVEKGKNSNLLTKTKKIKPLLAQKIFFH